MHFTLAVVIQYFYIHKNIEKKVIQSFWLQEEEVTSHAFYCLTTRSWLQKINVKKRSP